MRPVRGLGCKEETTTTLAKYQDLANSLPRLVTTVRINIKERRSLPRKSKQNQTKQSYFHIKLTFWRDFVFPRAPGKTAGGKQSFKYFILQLSRRRRLTFDGESRVPSRDPVRCTLASDTCSPLQKMKTYLVSRVIPTLIENSSPRA